jgi:dihydroflavonol-4-reductase
VLFHAAAYFREYYQPGDHWAELEALNVDATLELLEAAERYSVRRAVHVSTSGVIGMEPDGAPGDERTPPTPTQLRNLYFRSKHMADQSIDAFERRSSIEVVTVHPGWMFSPGDAAPTSTGALVLQFLRRELPGIPDGGMNVADARDVAAAMIAAAGRAPPGSHYVVGGPFATMAEIFSASTLRTRVCDLEQFERDLANPEITARVEQHIASGRASGVHSTPTFLLNGRMSDNAWDLSALRTAIVTAADDVRQSFAPSAIDSL